MSLETDFKDSLTDVAGIDLCGEVFKHMANIRNAYGYIRERTKL